MLRGLGGGVENQEGFPQPIHGARRWRALLLAASLVLGLAASLAACGRSDRLAADVEQARRLGSWPITR